MSAPLKAHGLATLLTTPSSAAGIALACLDLTSLKGSEDAAQIEALCDQAAHPLGAPAALCVYPAWVDAARRGLDRRGLAAVRVATVVSFPLGDASPPVLAEQVKAALDQGADEVDMVLPWRALQAAARGGMVSVHSEQPVPLVGLTAERAQDACRAAVRAARTACGDKPLKVIIESGELADAGLIALATRLAVEEGADFVKTSTGKARVHATPEAVATILATLSEPGIARPVGLKIAGGVQTLADVERYLALVRQHASHAAEACSPGRLRFGASSLWPVLVAALGPVGHGAAAIGSAPAPTGAPPGY